MPVATIDVVDAGSVTRNVNALPGLGTAADAASLPVAQSTEGKAQTGSLTETAPATDTASSGLNGRLQRIAQRLTSLIALIPASLGTKSAATSLAVALSTEDAATIGSLTETAPGTDIASSGLNGRLQRIAQRLTSILASIGTFGAVTAGRAVLYDGSGAVVDYTLASPTYPLPTTPVSGLTAAMTATTSTAVTGMGAPGSGKFNYITSIAIGNSHATVGTFVELQDGSGGATFAAFPAAAVYGGISLTLATPLKQPTSNTALYAKNTTTGANTIVSTVGFQA